MDLEIERQMNKLILKDYRRKIEQDVKLRDQYKQELTKDDEHLSHLVLLQLLNSYEFLMKKDKFYTLRWLEGWNRYVKDKEGWHTSLFNTRYTAGSVVLIELFGNFNPEFSYPHPALVVNASRKHLRNRLLVIPMTSDEQAGLNVDPMHIPLLKSDGMAKDSLLKLEDIRVISTSRVITKLNIKVSAEKRFEVNMKVVKLLFGNVNNELEQIKHENDVLTKRVTDLELKLNNEH